MDVLTAGSPVAEHFKHIAIVTGAKKDQHI